MGTHSHSYTTPAAQERPSTEEMADALDAGHGAAAIAAATRTYEEACADGHYDHAEYWCDVLRVLYRRYAEAAGGTTWDLTSPHAAVASIVATYGRDAAALLIQASIDETAQQGLAANSRFWAAAAVWLAYGPDPDLGIGASRQ